MKKIFLLTGVAGMLFAACLATGQTAPDANTNAPAAPDAPDAATDTTPQPPAAVDAPAPAPGDAPVQPPPSLSQPPAAVAPAAAIVAPAPAAVPMSPAPSMPAMAASPVRTNAAVTMVVAPVDTNSLLIPGTHEKGLRMNFRGVPLETVLNYMSDAAGFIIHPKVPLSGKVDVWSAQPLSADDAVKLLKQILSENGYTAMQDGRTLTIIKSDDAKKSNIPVISGSNPKLIPNNAEIATQIVPVHTLNVVQLVKDLEPLRPADMTLTADEAANSLVMTDTQANIRHMTEIVKALDSVTSGNSVVRVFPLKFADSKALASLIKDLFPSTDTTSSRNGNNNVPGGFPGFGGFGGNRGGNRGGGGESAEASANGHTPTAKVNAVSDDHSNSLVVSAPEEVMSTIEELVKQVDTPVEDETQVKLFHLKNADATEMADLLTTLFPDDTSSSDATQRRFPFFFGGQQPASSSSSTSERMKKLSHVTVAPDRRTSTLAVTAGKDLMPQIEAMVAELDQRPDRKMTIHVIPLVSADPIDVQAILQDLQSSTSSSGSRSGSSGGSSSSSSANNFLLNRATTLLQQQNSTTSSTIGGSSSAGRIGN